MRLPNKSSFKNNSKPTMKCIRPYHDEHTSYRLITEVNHRQAGIVHGLRTALEFSVSQDSFDITFLIDDTINIIAY